MHGYKGACMVAGQCMRGCRGVCVVVGGGMHGCGGCAWLWGGGVGYDEIRLMSRRYTSHWNAFLLLLNLDKKSTCMI